MPNDPTPGSFPLPNQTSPVKLTDAVAPDLSTPPIIEELPNSTPEPIEVIVAPEPTAPRSEAQIPSIPEGKPATMSSSVRKPFPVVTALLLLISIGAIAATYFFYQQTKSLNVQLTQITQTMQQQQIKENQTIPSPTLTEVISPTLAISETPIIPTPITTANTGKVFSNIASVIATAQKQYPTAQLIMIKTESFQDPTLATIKYWFRQTPTDKKYLYVLAEPGKDLVVVDQQVTVAENTLTPSLNQLAANSQLGIDLPEAISISSAACPTTFNCTISSVSGQYIKSNVTLWQITYKPADSAGRPSDNSQPFVVQIDAATKKILYKNQ